MSIQLNKSLVLRAGLALTLPLALWTPALAQALEPAKAKPMAMEGKPMEHAQGMQEQCKAMMAEMKAQDTELSALVARMNSAPKETKMDLLAEIITKMTEQRVAMNVRMGQMHTEMMKHMQMGMGAKPHHPMMKGMEQKPEATPKDKKE
jgi:hypothetical protein